MNDVELDALLARAATGELTGVEARRLAERCRADPRLAEALRRSVQIERLLVLHGSECSEPGAFVREVMARLDADAAAPAPFAGRVMEDLPARDARPGMVWLRPLLAAAAAAAVALGASLWLGQRPSPAVAELTASEAARWARPPEPLRAGTKLHLAEGFARVRFQRGAELILEGPAELEFTGDNAARLYRGTAAVDVPPAATGFTLAGPDTNVVDVGTRFAMRARADRPTEVHVLEGLVLTSTSAQPQQRELRADQAIAVVGGQAQAMGAEPARFLTALPERRGGATGYLHWSFDEPAGNVCANDGPGIDGRTTAAFFRAEAGQDTFPERGPGMFGGGIFLDGDSAYLETDFPGIGGGRARTVALWVKVPPDWTERNGYALASWGSFVEPGNAWQLSVNPGDFGGAVGHLRVGTHGGYAVGVTDLRDGRWHHVAAVMYESTEPADTTHVLLYVDGWLEPTEIKGTRRVDTDVASAGAAKLNIGRNASPGSANRFFRGWIDELFIADEALTQAQVEALMRENRFRPEPGIAAH